MKNIDSVFSVKIALTIRKKRDKLGLSQPEFGKLLGKSGGAISYWESGKRRPDILMYQKILDM